MQNVENWSNISMEGVIHLQSLVKTLLISIYHDKGVKTTFDLIPVE